MRGAQHWRPLGGCVALILLLFLDGCATRPPAPIEDRSSSPATMGRLYRVQPGDTLYSIAWRYGLDYPRLAAANDISAPFTIFVGQQIELREADPPAADQSVTDRARAVSRPVRSPASSPESARPAPPVQETRSQRQTAPAQQETSVQTPRPPPARTPAGPPLRTGPATPQAAVAAWRWPAEGPVVRGFSSTLHKGIDIAGAEGDPVVAVAPGQVVYAGTGIPGYGELLIVRHNDRYLSAYGHNDRLLVSEGDLVRAGQRIATRGSTGTNAVKLHFEIRENGKPIDPTGLLPRR